MVQQTDRHPLLAREGWIHTVLAAGAALVVTAGAGWTWSLPIWLLVVFVVQFFRDPPRAIPAEPGIAVCPADGRVIFAGPAPDPYLKRAACKISIFMNVFNVHSNWIPVGGRVRERWYARGAFVNAALDKASEHNERNALWIEDENGADVVVVQVAGLIARRILCHVGAGERVARGQRYGFIRFGSRLDIYLPGDFAPAVRVGDKVRAGEDPLGRFRMAA
jgi:phosphatidylserine decarboxylase